MKKQNQKYYALDQKRITNDEVRNYLVRESKGPSTFNIRSFHSLKDAYKTFLNYRGIADIFIELKNGEIIQLTDNLSHRLENLKKYHHIIGKYKNGDFGYQHMNLSEILDAAGEPDLLDQMDVIELQLLANCASGIVKQAFLKQKEKKLKRLNLGKPNTSPTLRPANYKDITYILLSWHDADSKNMCFDEISFENIVEAIDFWYTTRYNPANSSDFTNLSIMSTGLGIIEIGDGFKERSLQ